MKQLDDFVGWVAKLLSFKDEDQRLCSEAAHHGKVALKIFRGILEALTALPPSARPRLQQAECDTILRYLQPVLTSEKMTLPRSRQSRS